MTPSKTVHPCGTFLVLPYPDAAVPLDSVPGCRVLVEYYALDNGRPQASAYVADYRPTLAPVLLYVWTDEPFRRRGVATALLAFCETLFPGLWATDGITPAGEKLVERVTSPGWNPAAVLARPVTL